jgi:hypothetical protein
MKKIILAFCISCLLSLNASTQNTVTDSTATVIGYWKKGDKIRLSLAQTKEKYKGSELTSKGSSTSIIDVTIIDESKDSYTIKWKYTDVNVFTKEKNPSADKFSSIVKGLEIIFKTDEMGSFTELVNWKEIQNFIYKALDMLKTEYNDPSIDAAVNEVRKIYSSKESIEQVLIKEIQLYHTLYGGEYKLKENISIETQLPNVLGGEPFPAFLEIEMTSLVPSKNTCIITMTQKLDDEKTTKIILDWVEKVSKKDNLSQKIPKINITDKNEFEVELLTGWINKITSIRTAIAEEVKQIQTIEISVIK